jgi:phospholipase/carboxylesterase
VLKYEIYTIGLQPESLVIFLHGYNGNIADHGYAIDWIKNKLRSAYLVIPEAPEICDRNTSKRQWFGMLKYDADGIRIKPQTSTADIFAIYNRAAVEIDNRSGDINAFIDIMQKKYAISDDNTYIIGFSQGAMLTIYTALSRKNPVAGAFALSGLVAGAKCLEQKILARPPLYLFHGENDLKVQYKTFADSLRWLKNHNINCHYRSYPNLTHKITEEEINEIVANINGYRQPHKP